MTGPKTTTLTLRAMHADDKGFGEDWPLYPLGDDGWWICSRSMRASEVADAMPSSREFAELLAAAPDLLRERDELRARVAKLEAVIGRLGVNARLMAGLPVIPTTLVPLPVPKKSAEARLAESEARNAEIRDALREVTNAYDIRTARDQDSAARLTIEKARAALRGGAR